MSLRKNMEAEWLIAPDFDSYRVICSEIFLISVKWN
jgi:hypothetical protein